MFSPHTLVKTSASSSHCWLFYNLSQTQGSLSLRGIKMNALWEASSVLSSSTHTIPFKLCRNCILITVVSTLQTKKCRGSGILSEMPRPLASLDWDLNLDFLTPGQLLWVCEPLWGSMTATGSFTIGNKYSLQVRSVEDSGDIWTETKSQDTN
jgi:hypothetical protein